LLLTLAEINAARILEIRRTTLPAVSSWISWYPTWTEFLGIIVALILWDQVRRVGPIFSLSKALRVGSSVAISVLALSIPEYSYVNAVLYRTAALESPSDLAGLIGRNAANKFWQCWSDRKQLADAIVANRNTIETDLGRYGLEADLDGITGSLEGDSYANPVSACSYSLKFWNLGHQFTVASNVFQNRLSDIDAAQRYMRNGTGSFAELSLMMHFWMLGLAALAFGGLAALVAATALWRTRLIAEVRPILSVGRWRGTAGVPWDVHLASRWPSFWASRLHLTLPGLVFVSLISFLPALEEMLTHGSPWVAGLALLAFAGAAMAIYGAMRAQARARTLSTEISYEIRIAATHAAAAALLWLVPAFILQKTWSAEAFAASIFVPLFFCSFLQATRSGSLASAGTGLLLLIAAIVVWTVAWVMFGADVLESGGFLLAFLGPALFAVLFVKVSTRIEARPAVRRLAISMCLICGPVPALWFFVWTNSSVLTLASALAILYGLSMLLAGLAGIILVLRFTERARRAIQFVSR